MKLMLSHCLWRLGTGGAFLLFVWFLGPAVIAEAGNHVPNAAISQQGLLRLTESVVLAVCAVLLTTYFVRPVVTVFAWYLHRGQAGPLPIYSMRGSAIFLAASTLCAAGWLAGLHALAMLPAGPDPEPTNNFRLELFYGLNKAELLRLAEVVVLAILAVLILVLVVRPLTQRMFAALPTTAVTPPTPKWVSTLLWVGAVLAAVWVGFHFYLLRDAGKQKLLAWAEVYALLVLVVLVLGLVVTPLINQLFQAAPAHLSAHRRWVLLGVWIVACVIAFIAIWRVA